MLLGFLHILRSWFTDLFLNHATIFDRLCMMQRCLIFPTSRYAAWSSFLISVYSIFIFLKRFYTAWSSLHHALPFPGCLSLCGHLLTTSLHSISGRHYWFDKHTHIYIHIYALYSFVIKIIEWRVCARNATASKQQTWVYWSNSGMVINPCHWGCLNSNGMGWMTINHISYY